MIFGIDFDGTFAADPEFFHKLVDLMLDHGHTPVLVTQRTTRHRGPVDELVGNTIPLIFAGGFTKQEAASSQGFEVDVWIDDEPLGVYFPRTYVGP